jgi:Haem-binding domain
MTKIMAGSKFKSIAKKVFIALLVVFVIIQFIRPTKNNNTTATADDMNVLYPIPDSVHKILDKACFDCHSNNTRYPWYFSIQPVAWWMNDHINEGKGELNFSEFGKRTLARQAKKLKKLAKEVQDGGMPLESYSWIHKEAVLTENEKKMVVNWANALSERIALVAPPDPKK